MREKNESVSMNSCHLIYNIKDLIEKIDKTQELKNETIKNEKYISPFPVPGYSLDENLWEFIYDLSIKEENKNSINEIEIKDKQNFTGIKHLLKRKKTKPNSLEKIKEP